jgi:transcription antitermination factor NusG
MSQWYAVRAGTRREMVAAKGLAEAGITVFLPMEASWGTRPGQIGRVKVQRPLIRGYLFVLIEPTDEAQRQVLEIDGVHAFLGYMNERDEVHPLAIPLPLIIELQAAERAGRYDRTLRVKVKYRPKKGDLVRVTAGPWLSFFGKVLATPTKNRVHVMIEGPHGRGTMVEASHLSPAA